MRWEKIHKMKFSSVYPMYTKKAERKGKTKEDVDRIIFWLTGYDDHALKNILESETNLEDFFAKAPKLNPNVSKIKGLICGHRVEDIEHPLTQKIRYLDKLVDELARGKKMESILRK